MTSLLIIMETELIQTVALNENKFFWLKVMADFVWVFSFITPEIRKTKWPQFGNVVRWASLGLEAAQQLLSCLKMTGIAQVAVSSNNGLTWLFTVTGMY